MLPIVTPPFSTDQHLQQHAQMASTGTVVILGSSNGAGSGASTYSGDPSAANGWASPSTSWAGRLATALGAGWKVINRSISGTGFVASANRFWTDVAPHRPTHVILCNHPVNDGCDWTSIYQANLKLISFCERINAVPILRGAYMWNGYSAAQYQGALALNQALDQLGYHRIDHMSEFDNGSGGFIAGTTWSSDGLHPNDAGYQHFFDAIDLGIFTYGSMRKPRVRTGLGAWKYSNIAPITGNAFSPLNMGVCGNFGSITLRAKFKCIGTVGDNTLKGAAFLSFQRPSSITRVRNPTDVYNLAVGGGAGAQNSIISTDGVMRELVLRYNQAADAYSMWIDGVNVENLAGGVPIEYLNNFGLAGRTDGVAQIPVGFQFSEMAVWKVPLGDHLIRKLYAGDVPPASLVFYSDLSQEPMAAGSAAILANQVPNGLIMRLGDVSAPARA